MVTVEQFDGRAAKVSNWGRWGEEVQRGTLNSGLEQAAASRFPATDETIAELFNALGDPVRLQLVRLLAANGEMRYADLPQALPASKSLVAYHAKILQQAGLLLMRKEGRYSYCRLGCEALRTVQQEVGRWVPVPGAPGRPADGDGDGEDDDAVLLTW